MIPIAPGAVKLYLVILHEKSFLSICLSLAVWLCQKSALKQGAGGAAAADRSQRSQSGDCLLRDDIFKYNFFFSFLFKAT